MHKRHWLLEGFRAVLGLITMKGLMMAKRYFAKCDLDDGLVFVKKGDELFLSDARPNWLHRDGHYFCHTTSNQMEYIEVREEQQGHIHAELMMQYAQDAMETNKPWECWEFYNKLTENWLSTTNHPAWATDGQYRRMPKMISVTLMDGEAVSWPEPQRTELEYGDAYFYVNAYGSVTFEEWDCLECEIDTLSNGWIHLTEEAAKQHAAALRKINTQGA